MSNKHHPFCDMGENGFISFVGNTPERVFALIRFLGVAHSESRSRQVIICQRAVVDNAPSDSHGLVARRLTLEHFGFFELQQQFFKSIRLAQGICHDCPAASSHGTPCSFVTDYPVSSFSSGRKRFLMCFSSFLLFQDCSISRSATFNGVADLG